MEIDGVEFIDLAKETQQMVCHKIINNESCNISLMKKFVDDYNECDVGVETTEYTSFNLEEMRNLCNHIIDSKDCSESTMQTLVSDFMETNGKCKDLGHCETCGSYNYEYKFIL